MSNLASATLSSAQVGQDKTNALLSRLAESKQTDGGSSTQKNLVTLGLTGAVVILGLVYVAKKA